LFTLCTNLSVSVGAAKCLPHHFLKILYVAITMYHQCNGGTNTVLPLVMEMQTGSTNNHVSQIFFVLAAAM
jgi:hypothetical protein